MWAIENYFKFVHVNSWNLIDCPSHFINILNCSAQLRWYRLMTSLKISLQICLINQISYTITVEPVNEWAMTLQIAIKCDVVENSKSAITQLHNRLKKFLIRSLIRSSSRITRESSKKCYRINIFDKNRTAFILWFIEEDECSWSWRHLRAECVSHRDFVRNCKSDMFVRNQFVYGDERIDLML